MRRFSAIRRPLLYGTGGLIALALLFAIGSVLFREQGQAAAEAAYARAEEYYEAKDYRAARIELMNAVKASPNWTPGLIAQANVSLEIFDGQTAKIALEQAVGAGAEQISLQHLLGHALWMTGDSERAEILLSDPAIPQDNRAYALRILGRLYSERGDYDLAREAFDTALEIAPDDSRLWTEIARFRFVYADHMGAIAASDKAVALDPDDVRAIEFRGQMVRSQFGLAAALPWFERGLSINGDDIPLLEEYAVTLGELGRNRDMLAQARKILAINSKNGRAYYMQAVIAARAGDYALAQRILGVAGAAINETPGAMLVSAIAEYELGNFNKAADILDRLSSMQPGNMRVRRLLARAKLRAGNNLDALDIIQPLLQSGAPDSYDALLAARAFEVSGERDKAADGLSAASLPIIRGAKPLPQQLSITAAADGAQRNPGDARYAIPYIRALLLRGNVGQALSQARSLQARNPGVADSHILVGDVEAAAGDYRAAAVNYGRAREIEFSENVMLRLVDSYRRTGRVKEANEVLAAFVYFNPNNLSAQRLTAYLFIDEARWAEALPMLLKLRSRVGYNDSILNANLARTYSALNRHDEAIFNAQAAYKIDPANPLVTLIYGQVLLKSGQRPKAALELFEKADALIPGNSEVAAGLKAAKAAYKKAA
ncbi:tetratricopeptide repeat protein [Sphingorhabdus arenilitoris]|uniref:Tetratricopeptide repeat protein n=1 Tax=Sphingorhabdus arenilitoris TaxID=1490041 RepID=A0ABV8RFU6_9SPHN